jgi:coiled-coil domain-containing protein 63/114
MSEIQVFDSRQAELIQLQREYRHMEVNRRAYSEESQILLRKQQKTIEKLRSDNDMLRNDIATITRGSSRPLTVAQQQEIHRFHDMKEKYLSLIDVERENYQRMELEIDEMRQKVLSQRKAMGGVNAMKENHYMIQKQIRILENRLDKALIKFNESIAFNKTLRDKIDDLRRERVVFENIYRKMERELGEKKKAMAEIIESSNHAYETRDTYQMEIAAIEQANRKEQEEFEQQMVELGRLLDTDLALPLPTRGRTLKYSKTGTKPLSNHTGPVSHPSDNIIIESAALERVQNFEEAFARIRASTGITDVDELVRIYLKNEDHNFSLFNYVNEQNNEIEKCEEQIQALREEEAKLTHGGSEDVHHHKQALRELEAKLQSTEAMADKYEMRCQDLQRTVELLKRSVQDIYEKIGLSDDTSMNSITESNMVNYLGHIEQRANSLIESFQAVKPQLITQSSESDAPLLESTSKSTVIASGPKIPMGHDNIQINPPKLDDYNSDDDEDDEEDESRPLTIEELKIRTLNRMQRKSQSMGKHKKKRASVQKSTGSRNI